LRDLAHLRIRRPPIRLYCSIELRFWLALRNFSRTDIAKAPAFALFGNVCNFKPRIVATVLLNKMSSEAASIENDLKDFRIQVDSPVLFLSIAMYVLTLPQLETVNLSLQGDPDNADLKALEDELLVAIQASEELLAELRPAAPPPEPEKKSTPPPAEKPKWSVENHPAYQSGYRKPGIPESPPEPPTPVAYKVNDTVLAKWLTGDKGFYPARITSITGSSSDPVYYVTFKSYGNTEALRRGDIKPIASDSRKRKADGSPAASSTTPTGNTGVISAAASINPALASQAKKEPSLVSDGPPKSAKAPKKVKASRELEKNKSKWQDFTNKSKVGKSTKKESMFRIGDSVTARG
jgi:survival-of-motor-neuron-related-splicing factor 30